MSNDQIQKIKCRLTDAQEKALVMELKYIMEHTNKVNIKIIQDAIKDFFIAKKFPIDQTKELSSSKAYGFLKKHDVLKKLFWNKKEVIIIEKDDQSSYREGVNPFSYKDIPSPPSSETGEESKIKLLEEKIAKLEKSIERYDKLFQSIKTQNNPTISDAK